MEKPVIHFGRESAATFYGVNAIVTFLLGYEAARVLLDGNFNLIVVAFVLWLIVLPFSVIYYKNCVRLQSDSLILPGPFRLRSTKTVQVKINEIEKIKERKPGFWTLKFGNIYEIHTKDSKSYALKSLSRSQALKLSEILQVPYERHDPIPEIKF